MGILRRAIPKDLPITVQEIIPRIKEGGAFVKFSREGTIDQKEIEIKLRAYLKEHPIYPLWNPWRRVRAALVQGKPWLEDLYRFPSPRIRIDFLPASSGGEAAELSQEQIFALMRRYGKIADIASMAADSKALPKFATVTFKLPWYSIMARNCMHGFIVSEEAGGGKAGTLLRIHYEQIIKGHHIRDWIANHPRIIIPLLAALAGAIAVAVFDPIRTFFIKQHVCNNRALEWLKSQVHKANELFRHNRSQDDSLDAIWDDRKNEIDQIKAWLMETADTFIVVQGPRGSGKKELVIDQALKGRSNTLVIDCKPIQEARGDSATINAAAREVGYRPVFSWMNSVSSLIDLAAQGTIGTKTGFSETLDAQIAKILQNTATALRQVALEKKSKDEKDKDLDDDQYLEAHPEQRPVIVVDNFLHKNSEGTIVYDKVSEWAARIVTSNVAHVVFLTHDVSFSKSLSKALPDRVFRQIALGDCSPEVAKRYVIRHLDAGADTTAKDGEEKPLTPSQKRKDLRELDGCIDILGGRLTDLEFLARRIKAGETPRSEFFSMPNFGRLCLSVCYAELILLIEAVEEIISQSASEILKMYIFDPDQNSRPWSTIQAWHLIKALAKSDAIRYNETLLSDTFKSVGDSTLQSLEQAELISILSSNGRPYAIKPGKPVYSAAFQQLTQDKVLASRLDLAVLGELTKGENDSIAKCEEELKLLGSLPKQPSELTGRIQWLLQKVQASQVKVEGYERESAVLKTVLSRDF